MVQHDDGTVAGMHDLDIVYPDGRYGAVEANAAADAASIELWNLMNSGGRWIANGLAGGWTASLHPHARARRPWRELPLFLSRLERLGATEVRPRFRRGALEQAPEDLGIANACQGGTDFPRKHIHHPAAADRAHGRLRW